MVGTDLAAELLALRPDLPIILVTGYAAKLTTDQVNAIGIRELLLKPFKLQSLGDALHRALSARRS